MPTRDPLRALDRGGRLERWTVDEVLDGRARLLICVAIAEDSQTSLPRPSRLASLANSAPDLPAAAMQVELAPARQMWSDETAVFVEERELSVFLASRSEHAGLPGRRPLREGDVFWIVAPQALEATYATSQRIKLSEYGKAGVEVLDLTAAARQAVKVRIRLADLNIPEE